MTTGGPRNSFAVVLLPLLLGGCTAFGIAEAGTVVGTGKTASDHVVSWLSGKDCSVVRVEQDKTYCVEDEPNYPPPSVYCYPTLAQVVCYEQPDPRRGRELGASDHNVVK